MYIGKKIADESNSNGSDEFLDEVHYGETYETDLEGWDRQAKSNVSDIFLNHQKLAYKCKNPL